jgi:phosphate/sulfate permease
MENIYLVMVIVLFALAISDLIVGVSNDAVNFLNSAIGAKVARYRTVMIVAALGVFVGATFSDGMMEVARKGIFHPDQFAFSEIMVIFVAVMITDVILLDLFNTYGFPTSTTVSLVFELLGSAVAVAAYKIAANTGQSIADLGMYINSDKALAIISGILVSVVVAFSFGALIQYLARLLFSFNYERRVKFFGGLFGGFAVSMIIYFMLIKGAKGSSIIPEETTVWIEEHALMVLGIAFAGFTVILQLLNWLFKFNILRFVVLLGTFGLALAFAGNDLVNFIGVPVAGYESFRAFMANPGATPDGFMMGVLKEPVDTNSWFLLAAGLIMVVTLWTSRKAKSVVETTLNLSRQDEGVERFHSSPSSRFLVRAVIGASNGMSKVLPLSIKSFISRQFNRSEELARKEKEEGISFDMIRASVNLIVASVLIAFGTSLKLPLSTTYVTFMVAMGTSLADRAWGRESAVYRISGVLSVIGGWFLTAIIAFSVAFLIASIIYWGGMIALALLILAAVIFVFRTHAIHRRITRERKAEESALGIGETDDSLALIATFSDKVSTILSATMEALMDMVGGFRDEKLKELKKVRKDIQALNQESKRLKKSINHAILQLQEDALEAGPFYVQVVDYLREIAHSANYMIEPVYQHINNNHKGISTEQADELNDLHKEVNALILSINDAIAAKDYSNLSAFIEKQMSLLQDIQGLRKKQVRRIKNDKSTTKGSIIYLDLLSETKNLLLYSINIVKSMRDLHQAMKS